MLYQPNGVGARLFRKNWRRTPLAYYAILVRRFHHYLKTQSQDFLIATN